MMASLTKSKGNQGWAKSGPLFLTRGVLPDRAITPVFFWLLQRASFISGSSLVPEKESGGLVRAL
jgi:hypothetical protein